MFKTLLILFILVIASFALVKVAIAAVMLLAMIIQGTFRYIVVPVVYSIGWTLQQILILPLRITGIGRERRRLKSQERKLARQARRDRLAQEREHERDRRALARVESERHPAVEPAGANWAPVSLAACRNDACLCDNPASANFCRRCGLRLA